MSKRARIRRLQATVDDFRTRFARKRSRSAMSGSQTSMSRAGTPADVSSPRVKSSVHRKTTADKWNQ
jgi:hypothetical protein